MKDNVINYQTVAQNIYTKVLEIVKDDNSYPNDLIIDIQSILQYEPNNFLLFIKDYFSTSMFIIDNDHPYKNGLQAYYSSYLCLYNYYLREFISYSTILHCFRGKIHEYNLTYNTNKLSILFTLKFFYELHYKQFISCLNDETDQDLKSKAVKDHDQNIKIYNQHLQTLTQNIKE